MVNRKIDKKPTLSRAPKKLVDLKNEVQEVENLDNLQTKIEEIRSLDGLQTEIRETKSLKDLQTEIEKMNEEWIKKVRKVLDFSKYIWIDEYTAYEYLNIIKKSNNLPDQLDEDLKKVLWFETINSKITVNMWCFLFYVKKFCQKNFENILPLVYDMMLGSEKVISSFVESGSFKKFLLFIESYWDSSYEYLKFCSPFDNSYINLWISNIFGKNFWETFEEMEVRYQKMLKNFSTNNGAEKLTVEDLVKIRQAWLKSTSALVQFIENFVEEPESLNLYAFLKENPQKLNNLWWKEIKSINLSVNSWINFAFRWIIEMVKSRTDIEFPRFKKNASAPEKEERKQQREKIIKEYENMLKNYIAKDKIKENKGKTFDKIFFTTSHEESIDGSDDDVMPSKDWVLQFSWKDISDYSVKEPKYNKEKYGNASRKMLYDIREYTKEHPNEKILVCVNHHGKVDWSSGNWWTKEDWKELANISPNIKIWSIRCYFWSVFDEETIYNSKASVSWFSNKTITFASVTEVINDARNKNLWFHEMEIYTRLNYPVSITPLTDGMEYENRNTWKTEISKIGLAQNIDHQRNNDFDEDYT